MKIIALYIFRTTIALCACIILMNIFTKPVQAARLSLDPVTFTASKSATFDVTVVVDTAGEPTSSSEALLTFDGSILEVTKITQGAFYPENLQTIASSRVYVGGTVKQATDSRTGTGTLAIITFRGKKMGTSSLSFKCTYGQKNDSNINKNDPNATDILDCGQLVAGSYTVGTQSENPSTTPSLPPAPTKEPTAPPAKLPTSGHVFPTTVLIIIGIVALSIGVVIL